MSAFVVLPKDRDEPEMALRFAIVLRALSSSLLTETQPSKALEYPKYPASSFKTDPPTS
jgi:hypothetical protein